MAKRALLVVDLVQEWTNKSSAYYLGDLAPLIERVNQLIALTKQQGGKIILVRHAEPAPTDCFAAGQGAEFIPGLDTKLADLVITKHKISPFYRTDLEQYLRERGIEEIWLAGVLTNLCVRSAVADAYDRDFKVTIFEDCCTTFDKKVHQFTLADLKTTRPEIEITTLASLPLPS